MDKLERIKELIKSLNQHNINYYTLDNPSISDKQYDELYNELLKLEKETGVILPNSPTVKIGGETLEGFEKVQHKNKLWSLDKAQSFDELKDWIKRCETFIKEYNKTHQDKFPQLQYVITKKFDGLTLKCDYDGIDFTQGSTRGTGSVGEVVTEQCKAVINLPLQLKNNDREMVFASFHSEGLMTKKGFEEYNKSAKKPLKNLRNGTAGAIRNLDPKETAKRKPIMYFYNINDIQGKNFDTYQEQLDYMAFRGLPVAEYTVCNTYDEVIQAINNIESQRLSLAFDIDGAVVAINDLKTRELIGYTIKFPKYSIAYKYKAVESTTTLIGVEWNTSRQGRINPTGQLKPVDLLGTTVKRATLNNLDDIERKGVKINAEIFVRRSNDVIPEIMGVVESSLNNPNIKEIEIPKDCPSCGSPTEIRREATTNYLYCTNYTCKAKIIKSITHYASREAMNIVGLSEKTIEKFIELGYLKSIQDIYYLAKDKCKYANEIKNLNGFGETSYNNIVKAIKKSQTCKLESFIYALGIENVGIKTAKTLVEFSKGNTPIDTINNILSLKVKDLLKMEDCGDIVANSIYNWFSDIQNREMLGYLTQMELNFIEDKPKDAIVTQETPFKGKSLYPTGGFNMKKAELKTLLESLGAIVETGYKKSLDYLICGHDMSKSSKDKKAMDDNENGKANITILTEDQFIQIIKGN
jgi:DNA ligase (NAD+)